MIGVLTGGGSRDDLSRQLGAVGTLAWYERSADLVDAAAAGAIDAAIMGVQDERGASVAPMIAELGARCPQLPIVLHTRIDRAAVMGLLAAFVLGLRMECVVRPFARLEPVLRYMVSPSYRPGVAPLLLHHFLPRVPGPLLTFVAIAAVTAWQRRSVEEIAHWTRLSVRTLERRLQRARWPAPHVVTQSFAALDAVWLMTEYGWSARRVRTVRGFTHPSAVTRLLASYAGTRPATLVEEGGFAGALAHVTNVLLRG